MLSDRALENVQKSANRKPSKGCHPFDMRYGGSFTTSFKTELRTGSFLLPEWIHNKIEQQGN